ncbi:hypothetical protein TSOC_006796 [Tetrabaena socialis]|uniref:Transmembrane protein n=1 Tax=Tetrabaena socialis TaxID=47790 RepID=A0A2J8A2S6_9CHLO|nr:hypothetical protein TSOC_006796 [Tetrabaena socialis]|eukprot:PNH06813.1 hypothetical protein TSOC_006796 [Tetrabaena socialis]
MSAATAEAAASAASSAPAPAAALDVVTTAASAQPLIFEPQLPDASILAAQSLVLVLTLVAAGYWWLVVVPSERAAVGRSKRLGTLATYLEELEQPEAAEQRRLERWFYSDWLRQREARQQRLRQQRGGAAAPAAGAERLEGAQTEPEPDVYAGLEGQRPDDNLLRPTAATPTPRFFSLDNPIVATAALLGVVGLLASLQR